VKSRDYECVILDLDKSIEEQGDFDCILSKILLEYTLKDEKSKQKLERLREYEKKHKGKVAFIDPVDDQIKTMDRQEFSELFLKLDTKLQKENMHVRSPKFTIIKKEEKDYTETLKKAGIHFPIMAKHLEAGGSEHSHIMGALCTEKGLHSFHPPFLVQEYYNHDAVIFKVFYIGPDNITVVRRPSLANLKVKEQKDIIFDSQKPWPKELSAENPPVDDKEKVPDIDMEVLKKMTKFFLDEIGMSLGGYDVIRQNDTNYLGLLDINYFPGYKGVDQFKKELFEWIEKNINEIKKKINEYLWRPNKNFF